MILASPKISRRDTPPHRTAFTLIEVLATLVLIAIVLPVAMKGISLATAAAGSARHNAQAVALAETKLNELATSSQIISANQSGDFAPDWPDYKWTAQSVSRDTNLMELSVQVSWMARGSTRSVSLTTLVYTNDSGTMTGSVQ